MGAGPLVLVKSSCPRCDAVTWGDERGALCPACRHAHGIGAGWSALAPVDRLACGALLAVSLLAGASFLRERRDPLRRAEEAYRHQFPSDVRRLVGGVAWQPADGAPALSELMGSGAGKLRPNTSVTYRSARGVDPWGTPWVRRVRGCVGGGLEHVIFSAGPDGVFEGGAGDDLALPPGIDGPWSRLGPPRSPGVFEWLGLLLLSLLALRQLTYRRHASAWVNLGRSGVAALPVSVALGVPALVALDGLPPTPGRLVPWQVSVVGSIYLLVTLIAMWELTTRPVSGRRGSRSPGS